MARTLPHHLCVRALVDALYPLMFQTYPTRETHVKVEFNSIVMLHAVFLSNLSETLSFEIPGHP